MSVDPNFLFIGAARCASTWLHECLREHPDVCVPQHPKELHFFNRDSNYEQGLDSYRGHFVHHAGEKAIGEVTPTYLCDEKSPARIHEHYPQIRMVVTLRNPIERAYSAYKGHVLSGRAHEGEPIIEASRRITFDNQASIVEQGFYYQHLQRYLQYFSRDQLLIQLYDDLEKDAATFLQRILSFIEVDPTYVPKVLAERIHVSFRPHGRRAGLIRSLNQAGAVFRNALPVVHKGLTVVARKMRDSFAVPDHSAAPDQDRAALIEIYRPENERLAEFLGRDLSAWQS